MRLRQKPQTEEKTRIVQIFFWILELFVTFGRPIIGQPIIGQPK